MADTVPQVDRILADAVTRSLEESDGHTIDVAAAATLARTVVPDLLAKVEKLTAERDEARRALARAERDERVVGFRRAIADLRDRAAFGAWSMSHAGRAAMEGQAYNAVCATFLESRLSTPEGPSAPALRDDTND